MAGFGRPARPCKRSAWNGLLVCQDCNREWILRNIDPTEQRDRMRRRNDWPPETLKLIQSIEKFRNLADQV